MIKIKSKSLQWLIFPVLDKQQLEVICSRAHVAAKLQSLKASLRRSEAGGPVGLKQESRRRRKKVLDIVTET